jgi:hypothetical protein
MTNVIRNLRRGFRRPWRSFLSWLPDGLQYRLALRRLQRARTRSQARYARLREQHLRNNASDEDMQLLTHNELGEMDDIDEGLHLLHTRELIKQAERYFLSVPEFKRSGGDWEQTRLQELWVLRRAALQDLRSAIRKEQKERRELRQMNLIWVTALTGAIGALTGLVAAFHWGQKLP